MGTSFTVKAVAALKPQDKPYSVSVSRGLRIKISTSGVKNFIVQYVVKGGTGKQIEYWLSRPWGTDTDAGHLSLADARTEAEKIRVLAREGIDFQAKLEYERIEKERIEIQRIADEKAAEADNLTVKDLFDAWIKICKRKDGGADLRRTFNKDVLPFIGNRPLQTLIESDITELLENVVNRDAHRTSIMLRNNLQQMFLWGEGRKPWKKLIDNPVVNIKLDDKIFSGYDGSGRDRNLSAEEIKELSIKLPNAGLSKQLEILVWILLACCTRIGETTKAQWVNIDFEAGVWKIPGADAKNGTDHTVFLSSIAIRHFKQLFALSNGSIWCFPDAAGEQPYASKNATKQIRDRQMSAMNRKPLANRTKLIDALVLLGGDWVPHDLRRTGATMMQSLGVTPEVIERILNHTEQEKLKKIYHQYDYAREKRDAWRLLGERIEMLVRQDSNVTLLRAG